MVWLGDNVCLRPADWDSPTSIRRRYAHARALGALQPLLGLIHHYATWDDADYGPPDAGRAFSLRETSQQTFRRYWPLLVGRQTESGIASAFQWADVQFFLLDNQWQRTPAADDPAHGQLLGAEQLRWLTESLAASKATFKVVCVGGQVLNPAGPAGTYAQYGQERAELLARLAATRVAGVVFLTGGRSHAGLSCLNRPGLYPFYDFTTAPLTVAPAQDARSERNSLRDSATFYVERNFALLDVAGAAQDRTLSLTLCGADGRALWKRTLRAADLQPGATPLAPLLPAAPDSATANRMAVPPVAFTRTMGVAKAARLRSVRRRRPRGAAPRSAARFSVFTTLRAKGLIQTECH